MTTSEPTAPGWGSRLAGLLPLDVVAAWAFAGVAAAAALRLEPGVLRFVLATPLLFVVPGYLVVCALFPHAETATGRAPVLFDASDRLAVRERFALAFGLSLALLPIVGLAVAVSPLALRTRDLLLALLAVVALAGVVAGVRRARLPPQARFVLPLDAWLGELRAAVGTDQPSADRALNVVLLASVLLALVTAGYALAAPQDGEQFTDVAVLTEDGDELVAGGYPDAVAAGEDVELVTAIENREAASREYTVVVTAERPASAERGQAEQELRRFEGAVDVGERWTHRHTVSPTLVGDRVRLNYYVYRGDAPPDPGPASAYRHLYVWVTVTEGE